MRDVALRGMGIGIGPNLVLSSDTVRDRWLGRLA